MKAVLYHPSSFQFLFQDRRLQTHWFPGSLFLFSALLLLLPLIAPHYRDYTDRLPEPIRTDPDIEHISTKNEKIAVTVTLYQNNRDSVVRETGLEPVRYEHTPLKRARLPIPPLSLGTTRIVADKKTNVKPFLVIFL